MTKLASELSEGSVRAILALRRRDGRGGGVEIRRLLLAEIRRMTGKALLGSRGSMRRLGGRLALLEVV